MLCSRVKEMVRVAWRLRRFVKIFIQPILLLLFIVKVLNVAHHRFTFLKNSENMSLLDSKSLFYVPTCSKWADKRGPYQKIVSFSIYGSFSNPNVVNRYLKPLRETVDQISVIYPGMNIVLQYYQQKIFNFLYNSVFSILFYFRVDSEDLSQFNFRRSKITKYF